MQGQPEAPDQQGRLEPLLASPDQLGHLALDRLAPLVPQEQHRLWLAQLALQAPLVRLAMIQLLPVPRVQQELVAPLAPQAQILPLQARQALLV